MRWARRRRRASAAQRVRADQQAEELLRLRSRVEHLEDVAQGWLILSHAHQREPSPDDVPLPRPRLVARNGKLLTSAGIGLLGSALAWLWNRMKSGGRLARDYPLRAAGVGVGALAVIAVSTAAGLGMFSATDEATPPVSGPRRPMLRQPGDRTPHGPATPPPSGSPTPVHSPTQRPDVGPSIDAPGGGGAESVDNPEPAPSGTLPPTPSTPPSSPPAQSPTTPPTRVQSCTHVAVVRLCAAQSR